MATFDLGKDLDKIVEPELMDEAWYPFEIYKEPEQAKNKIMKNDGADAEGAGYNVVVSVRCIEESEHKGRVFTVYLPLPAKGDDQKRNPVSGMLVIDQKVKRNAEFALAFGGTVEGRSFSLAKGMIGQLPVIKQMDMSGVKFVNGIAPFNEPCAKPIASDDLGDEVAF